MYQGIKGLIKDLILTFMCDFVLNGCILSSDIEQ